MPGAGRVLEVRRAHVVHVFGVERCQHIRRIECQTAGIVGALEVLFGGIERHRLVEIQIAHVIDRQLGVEAEAVGEVEFHDWLESFRGGLRIISGSLERAHLLIQVRRIS